MNLSRTRDEIAGLPQPWRSGRLAHAFVLAAAVLVCVATLLAGCQTAVPDRSFDKVRAAGRIAVAIDPTYPPFASLDAQGQPVGYEIELAKEIGRRLGVSTELVSIDVGSVVDALVARKIDAIISGISPDPYLSKQITFSRPYFNNGSVLIAPRGSTGLEGLAGGAIGVESGSSGDLDARKLARKIAGLRVKSYTTPEAALADVRTGRIDAAVTDAITARQLAGGDPTLVTVEAHLADEFYVVAVKRGDQILIGQINRTLDELDQDGYLERLAQTWLR